jgi:hypothetical protein
VSKSCQFCGAEHPPEMRLCPNSGDTRVTGTVSTPETPRTWTLWICNECGLTTASFPPAGLCYSVKVHANYSMTQVEVVEKAPVDVERERLLDLLDELMFLKDGPRDAAYHAVKDVAWERVRMALREYGRLKKEES